MEAFSFWIGLGASLGMWRVLQGAPRRQANDWLNAALLTLAGGLAGARLFFVLVHAAYFLRHPLEALMFWQGGLSWPGAVLGAAGTAAAISAFRSIPLPQVMDHLAALAPPLAVTAWLGCWQAGCGYGPQLAAGAPLALPGRDESGLVAPRLPVQLLAALSLLVYYAWLELRARLAPASGQKGGLTALGLALNLLFFSFLQADPAPRWLGLRLDTWAALVFALWAAAVTWRAFRIDPRKRLRSNAG